MTTTRHRRRRYAQGKNAIAECMRSGQKMRYRDLVEDGQIPGLLVHPDWYEPRHPQEIPVPADDAVALWRPSPELSIPTGEYQTIEEWEQQVIAGCPASPLDLRYSENTTVAVPPTTGELSIAVETAVNYANFDCLYVELDGGGWFISLIANDNPVSPQFTVPSVLPWGVGTASVGNQVYLGVAGSGAALLDGSWTSDPGSP